jgi:hypothetical protein
MLIADTSFLKKARRTQGHEALWLSAQVQHTLPCTVTGHGIRDRGKASTTFGDWTGAYLSLRTACVRMQAAREAYRDVRKSHREHVSWNI